MTERSLPHQTTPFIGREDELGQIVDRLHDPDCRLLTIVGSGGVGKTRLAIEAAKQTTEVFDDGVYFVNLQPVGAADIWSAIADALPLSLSGREPPLTQLLNFLRKKEMLLLLDNFEHLLDQASLFDKLLSQALSVKLLITSREALNLHQEWLYPLRGLPVPSNQEREDPINYGAVRLFLERARRVRPDFSLENEQSDIVDICRLVEGNPLALELAASWTRAMPCAAIATEIQRNMDFLSTSMRDVPERHRSMQAVFAQSWQLLSAKEQEVFKQLSVFRGSFDLAAARVVAQASLSELSKLVDKCLLRRGDDGRYTIHELIRQFGASKLGQSPDAAKRTRERHGTYFADFLDQRVAEINGPDQLRACAEVEDELENVRTAWHWAVNKANTEAIRRCASTFFYFFQMRSRFLEGVEALAKAATALEKLPSSNQRDLTLAIVYNHEGWLRIRVGNFNRAETILLQSLELFASHNEPPPPFMGCDSAVPLGIIRLIDGDHDKAVALGEAARKGAVSRDDTLNLSFAHYLLTTAKAAQGQYEKAYEHAQRACSLARQAGNRWFLAYSLNEWGNVALAMGSLAEAKKHFQASYAIKEKFDDVEGMAVALNHLGEVAVRQSNYAAAKELFQESLDLYRDINDQGGRAASLRGLGQVAYGQQAYENW